jgi:hypothetical protein
MLQHRPALSAQQVSTAGLSQIPGQLILVFVEIVILRMAIFADLVHTLKNLSKRIFH